MTGTSMKTQHKSRRATQVAATEPVGIVISRGRETESLPRFSAYMYAPDPEESEAPAAALATV